MEPVIECVPNVSVGPDEEAIAALSGAISSHAGVLLLDRSSDVDHARSVFTAAGEPGSVLDAAESVVATALELIDMRNQRGAHPRVGAVDVVPFVPLGGVDLATCAVFARSFGERIAERFDLPVYLYGAAALGSPARSLAAIRRPGFEGLAEAMQTPPGAPDIGPSRPHPTAGAVCVGARPLLVAWNIQLASSDVAMAKRIAARIRERGGGLHGVQALGIDLASEGRVQLSMNVLDYEFTPLWRVWEEAERLAADEGVGLSDSELIGLVPRAAMLEVADHFGASSADEVARLDEAGASLHIRDFAPDRVLEYRLAQAMES